MTFPFPVAKVTIDFSRTGGEIAQTGFWVAGVLDESTPSQGELNSYAADVLSAVSSRWTSTLRQQSSADTKLTGLKVAWYGPNSVHASLAAVAAGEFSAGSSSFAHGYELACVASLRTSNPSRSGRGRMYLPTDGIGITAGGQYTSAQPPALATSVAGLLTAVNDIALGGEEYLVHVVSWTTNQVHQVTSVIVNSIPDVQRRRNNRNKPATTGTAAVT